MRFQKSQPAGAATLVPLSASTGPLKNMDASSPATYTDRTSVSSMVLRWCPCKGSRQMEWCGGVVVVTGSRYREGCGLCTPSSTPP